MTATPLDIHKEIKRLQSAGMNEKQAEEMVNLFGEIYGNEVDTKRDLEVLHKDLKANASEIKTNLSWIKKFMSGVGVVVLIATLKYIFLG